jgi:hypothetical protein
VIKSYGQGGSGKNKRRKKEGEEKRAKQVVATLNVLQLSLLNQEKMLMIM